VDVTRPATCSPAAEAATHIWLDSSIRSPRAAHPVERGFEGVAAFAVDVENLEEMFEASFPLRLPSEIRSSNAESFIALYLVSSFSIRAIRCHNSE